MAPFMLKMDHLKPTMMKNSQVSLAPQSNLLWSLEMLRSRNTKKGWRMLQLRRIMEKQQLNTVWLLAAEAGPGGTITTETVRWVETTGCD